jgi:hypothetical protein
MVDLNEKLGKFPEVNDMHVINICACNINNTGKIYTGIALLNHIQIHMWTSMLECNINMFLSYKLKFLITGK